LAMHAVARATNLRKTVECPVCSRADGVAYLEARGYRVAQCRSCGLWYVNPQPEPEELRQFYASYDDGEQWRKLEGHFNRAIRAAILRRKNLGSVLDVGCGSGNFLRCMKEKGFSVFGIEPSGSGSDYARNEHGLDIYHGMMEDYLAAQAGQRFDVITLLNVLEHLTDPAGALVQLRQALVSDGVLAVVVPDARFHDLVGRLRRRLGFADPYWIEQPKSILSGFKLPDHLCSFQPATLAALLNRCGLRVVAIQNAPIVLNADLKRNLGKLLVRWASQTVYYLTFQRVVVGYSTLVLAQKTSD
jgi:SAM-dependent methyltransferase